MTNQVEMDNKSILSCKDLYIEEFSYKNVERKIGTNTFHVKNEVDIEKKEDEYIVKIKTSLETENKTQSLYLISVGKFAFTDVVDDDTKEELININAVAIMFPYVRSEVTLLTTQPGVTPVILPPVNVNELMKK